MPRKIDKPSPVNPMRQGQIIFHEQNLGDDPAKGRENTMKSKPKKERDKAEYQVRQMARKSSQVLFTTKTVFPFDLFPDTLTINANKIDVVNSEFFASTQTTSIPLHDIANVEVQTAPFFATLRITNIRYPTNPIVLNFLKKNAAIKAKNIIDGLLVAVSQGADVANIEPAKLLRQIEQAGKSLVES